MTGGLGTVISRVQETCEESALDSALLGSIDPGLKASLQQEQRERRRRFTLLGGVIVASILVASIGIALASGLLNAGDKDAVDRAVASEELTAKAYKLWQAGNLAEAQKKFERALKQDSENAQAWNGLGWTLLNQGSAAKAEEAFGQCVKLHPNHAASLNGLGQVNLGQRKYKEAEEYFLKAENAPAAWFGLLRVYVLTEKFDQAKTYLKKIEATGQTNAIAGIDKIKAAISDEKLPDELRTMIEPPKPISEDGTAAEFNMQGWGLLNKGQARAAQVAFESALERDPKLGVAESGLAFAFLNQGKISEAKTIFERLIKDDDKAFGPMNGLARCLLAEGNTIKAAELFKKVDESIPGVNAGTFGLADLYFAAKNWKAAIPYLERLVKQQPSNKKLAEMLEQARLNSEL